MSTMNTEQQQITGDLAAARARLEELTDRQGTAQGRLAALKAERETAIVVMEADPEDKGAGQQRRLIRDLEDTLRDYETAVSAATTRIGELETAQQALERKTRAFTAQRELEAHLRLAAELDAEWGPMLLKLAEFIESASDVAALAAPLIDRAPMGAVPRLPGERVLAVLIWRLRDVLGRLDATALQLALSDRDAMVTFRKSETARWARVRQTINEIL